MTKLGIDPSTIFNPASSNYNVLMQQILDMITVPELISNAQSLLNPNLDPKKLGEYTDFDKIFIKSKDIITFKINEFKLKSSNRIRKNRNLIPISRLHKKNNIL